MNINIDWSAIYKLCGKNDFENDLKKWSIPGIYIWGFFENNNFLPWYVGKHKSNMNKRLFDHFAFFWGGLRAIPKENYYKIKKSGRIDGNNLFYIPNGENFNKLIEFFEVEDTQKMVKDYINKIGFCYGKVNKENLNILNKIENKAILIISKNYVIINQIPNEKILEDIEINLPEFSNFLIS